MRSKSQLPRQIVKKVGSRITAPSTLHLLLGIRKLVRAIFFCQYALWIYSSAIVLASEDNKAESTILKDSVQPPETKSDFEDLDIKRAYFSSGHAPQEVVNRFSPAEFDFRNEQGGKSVLPYRLHLPSQLKQGEKYPLILWLHGWGESGRDNWGQLNYMQHALHNYEKDFPAFILAPQISSKESWGGKLPLVHALLQETIREHPVNVEGISLVGISSGGTASWEMGILYPSLFSAIAPLSSFGGDIPRIEHLVDTTVWTFHNVRDVASPIERVRQTVNALHAAGGRVFLLELNSFEGGTHNTWSAALRTHNLFSWLLERRRGDLNWKPPVEIYQKEISWTSMCSRWLKEYYLPVIMLTFAGILLFAVRSINKRGRVLTTEKH